MLSRWVLLCATGFIVGAGCATSKGQTPTEPEQQIPPQAPLLSGAPTVALSGVDAPGFDIDDLTLRLREAMARTSGVDIVDMISVRKEIASCLEMPCKDTDQERFKTASIVASATLARVGTALIGSLSVHDGVAEVVRVNVGGTNAAAVIQELGFLAGDRIRATFRAEMPTHQSLPLAEK